MNPWSFPKNERPMLMPMRPSSGNMYTFVSHTWNPVKGECPHDCTYCYMKRWGKQKPLRLDKKELTTDLGMGNFNFVVSGTDLFADNVPENWICQVLEHCRSYPGNRYLFQSKNPRRMYFLRKFIPSNSVVATTIETNRHYEVMGSAPAVAKRAAFMFHLKQFARLETMVTIEPVIDFDLDELLDLVRLCSPSWVNVGADSKRNSLPEPSPEKIQSLINELSKFTEVKLKKNLNRLLKEQ